MATTLIKCPLCEGCGKIQPIPTRDKAKEKKRAIEMKRLGFTLRAIAAMLGYDHPQSIQHLLNHTPKMKK